METFLLFFSFFWVPSFNFLASLINGNVKKSLSSLDSLAAFNFLASLINGNDNALRRIKKHRTF